MKYVVRFSYFIVLFLFACTNANIDLSGMLNSRGKGGNSGPYLNLNNIMMNQTLTLGTCRTVSVGSYDVGGAVNVPAPTYVPSSNVTVGVSTSGGLFFDSISNCLANAGALGSNISKNINAGSSNTGDFYFRATTAGSFSFNLSSSDSKLYVNATPYTIGAPVVKLLLPDVILAQVCYEAKARLFEADGVQEMQGAGSGNYNLSSLSNVFYSSAGCISVGSTTTSFSFAGGNPRSTDTRYIKLPSNGFISMTLSSSTTIPTAAAQDKVLNEGGGANIVDGIGFKIFPNGGNTNNITPGDCTMVQASLINNSGTIVSSSSNSSFFVKLSALDPATTTKRHRTMFYSDPGCSTNLKSSGNNDKLQFSRSQWKMEFWVRVNEALGSSLQFSGVIHGSDLVATNSISYKSPIYNIQTNWSEEPYIYADLPDFWKMGFIGDHEFPKVLQFNAPAGMIVTCSENAGPWTDCNGKFNASTRQLTLSFPDFSSNNYTVIVSNSMGWNRSYSFSKTNTYPELTTLSCGTTHYMSVSAISGTSPICLNSGVQINLSSTGSFGSMQLIGHSDMSNIVNINVGSSLAGLQANTATVATTLANLKIISTNAAAGSVIKTLGSGVSDLNLSNLIVINDTNASSRSVHLAMAGTGAKVIKNVTLSRTTASSGAAAIEVVAGANMTIQSLNIDAQQGTGILFNNSGPSSVSILDSSIQALVQSLSTYVPTGSLSLTLSSNSFSNSALSGDLAYFQNNTSASLYQNYFNSFGMFDLNLQGNSGTLGFYDNLILQNAPQVAMQTSFIGTASFERNHFVKVGGGSSHNPVDVTIGGVSYFATDTNYACYNSGFNAWLSPFSTTTYSPTGNFFTTNITGQLSSPRNLCTSPL